MNLTTDPWIPIVWENGKPDKVSLKDAFEKGDQIRDLAVRPHERIALMRLLICVAQAALNGPKDHNDWKTCRDKLPQVAADYLAKWKHAFELFGDGQRFLQVKAILPSKQGGELDETNSPSKLDFALASGNGSTLFDNAGGTDRRFLEDVLALLLLTFQNFSPGGLITDVKWNGISMGRTSNHAPCVIKAMLHAYIQNDSLLGTICGNLLVPEQVKMLGVEWGCPIWERMPDSPNDSAGIENATRSYLGRLVPLSRLVNLSKDGRSMLMGTAIPYDPDWREVAATIVVRERNGAVERTSLNASLAKSVWREAHAVSVLAKTETQMLGGPLALMLHDRTSAVDIWCGALVANKAKLLDAIESVLHIPSVMFMDVGQKLYQRGVQHAELWGRKIGRAVSVYHSELHDDLDKAEFRKRGNVIKQKIATHYWTAIEQKVPFLLALIEDPAPLFPEGASKECWGATEWGKSLACAARAAYDLACSHETPRQLKAYAFGLNVLFKPIEIETNEPATEETEE